MQVPDVARLLLVGAAVTTVARHVAFNGNACTVETQWAQPAARR
jgi:hypothetical protein